MIKDNDQRKQLGFLSYAFLGKLFSSPLLVGDHNETKFVKTFSSHVLTLRNIRGNRGKNKQANKKTAAKRMTYETPLFTKIFLSPLTVIEALVGVLSNASILLLNVRFKSLQTVGNLLLANLAVVDMLNAAINMPIQLLYTLLEPRLFRGPVIAFLITFLQRVFVFLNLASMLVLLANMYFGIAFNLRYYAWKTHRKAALCCFLIWLICTSLAQLSCLPILSIDLGDSPVGRHRAEIFNQGKHQFIAVALFVLFGGIVFVVLIVCSIRRSRMKVISQQLIFTELLA